MTDKVAVSEMAFIEFASGGGDQSVTFVLPPGGQRFAVKSVPLLEILTATIHPMPPADLRDRLASALSLSSHQAQGLMDALIERGVLEMVGAETPSPSQTLWQQYNWEVAGLYHFMSRGTRVVDVNPSQQGPMDVRERVVEDYRQRDPFPYRNISSTAPGDAFIPLPEGAKDLNWPLGPTLLKRRTLRTWTCRTLALQELGDLLWYGLRPIAENRAVVHSDPGFTQLRPLMTHFAHLGAWVLPIRVDGVSNGTVYRYDPVKHRLIPHGSFAGGQSLETLCVGQVPLRDAGVVVILSGMFDEFMWRYRHNRAYSVMLLEVGQMMQNLILAATALGVRPFITPALKDSSVDDLLGIDGYGEGSLYLSAFGK